MVLEDVYSNIFLPIYIFFIKCINSYNFVKNFARKALINSN